MGPPEMRPPRHRHAQAWRRASFALLLAVAIFGPAPDDFARAQDAPPDLATAERAVAGAADDESLAEALDDLIGALAVAQDFPRATEVAERALLLRRQLHGPDDPRTIQAFVNVTTLLRVLGQEGLARLGTRIDRLAEIDANALGTRAPEVAYTLFHYAVLAQPENAVALTRRAIALWEAAGTTGEPFETARAHLVLLLTNQGRVEEADAALRNVSPEQPAYVGQALAVANLHFNAGELDKAQEWSLRLFERPVEQLRALGPTVALQARQIATDLGEAERWAEAGALLAHALRLQQALLPADDPEIAETMTRAGMAAFRDGRPDDAIAHFRAAVEIFDRGSESGGSADFARTMAGELLFAQGRYREAEPYLRDALAKAEAEGHPDPLLRARLGRLKIETNDLAAAERLLRGALQAHADSAPSAPRQHAEILNDLGRVYDRMGRYGDAEERYRQALAALQEATVPDQTNPEQSIRDRAKTLGNLAKVLWTTGRTEEARTTTLDALSAGLGRKVDEAELEPLLDSIIADRADLPPEAALATLADIERLLLIRQSRPQSPGEVEAVLPLLRKVAEAKQEILPPGDREVAASRNNVAVALTELGRPEEAAEILKTALAAYDGGDALQIATLRINRASALRKLGSTAATEEALRLVESAQANLEEAMGVGEPAAIDALGDLASLSRELGRLEEADALFARVLQAEEARGVADLEFSRILGNVASLRVEQKRYAEAEGLLRRALAISTAQAPENDPRRMAQMSNLATTLGFLNRREEALELQRRVVALDRATLPAEHPELAQDLASMAALLIRLDRLDEADQAIQEALQAFGDEAKDGGEDGFTYGSLLALNGVLELVRDEGARETAEKPSYAEALADLRQATALLSAPDRRDLPGSTSHLPFHVYAAMRAAENASEGNDDAERTALLAEAFAAAQGIKQLSASRAVVAAGARWAARETTGDDALADAVRRYQDALAALGAARGELAASFAATGPAAEEAAAEEGANRRARLRQEIADLEAESADLRRAIAERFPRYAALSEPAPLSLGEAQALLGPDEALILFATSDLSRALPGTTGSVVVAVTSESVVAKPIAVDAELGEAVHALRCAAALTDRGCGREPIAVASRGSMNVAAEADAAPSGVPAFDTALAERVYQATFAPVEAEIASKRHWLVVPDQTLVGLPLNLLVRPGAGKSDAVDWIIREHAVSVLPAASTLRTLRGSDARPDPGGLAFLGVGDPAIGDRARRQGPVACATTDLAQRRSAAPPDERSLGSSGPSGLADPDRLRRLAALPDTRCELQTIADRLGQNRQAELLLGREATETRLKTMSEAGALARFRTVSFATHGLLGDEVGQHEAALVLTPPEHASLTDDGLLTASEIAGLKLGADWVILSACNTAAGRDEGDEEGLSGLASAFFYAGARSLLVSSWPVYSDAAARLTTTALAAQGDDPAIGRAEALRRAMLSVLDDPAASPRERHPAYWAPFTIVGEGGSTF